MPEADSCRRKDETHENLLCSFCVMAKPPVLSLVTSLLPQSMTSERTTTDIVLLSQPLTILAKTKYKTQSPHPHPHFNLSREGLSATLFCFFRWGGRVETRQKQKQSLITVHHQHSLKHLRRFLGVLSPTSARDSWSPFQVTGLEACALQLPRPSPKGWEGRKGAPQA